jgi:ABC-2 type transport system ATP-binding protein
VAILSKGALVNVGALDEILSARIKAYEIEAMDVPEALVSELEKISVQFVRRTKTLLFVIDKEDIAEQTVKRIISSPGHLVSYTPRRETLEEYFIRNIEKQQ